MMIGTSALWGRSNHVASGYPSSTSWIPLGFWHSFCTSGNSAANCRPPGWWLRRLCFGSRHGHHYGLRSVASKKIITNQQPIFTSNHFLDLRCVSCKNGFRYPQKYTKVISHLALSFQNQFGIVFQIVFFWGFIFTKKTQHLSKTV